MRAIFRLDRQISAAYAQCAEADMVGAELRDLFENILPPDLVAAYVAELGIQERQRKLDVSALLLSMVVSGGNHRFGSQADMLRRYVSIGCPEVTRAAFYSWFTTDLAALLERLSMRACAWVASRPRHLPGLLAGRSDWRVVDATTVKLPVALRDVFPGDGDYAALKLHIEYSLGVENIVGYTISPARESESRHLVIDDRRRSQGLLVDLGYASHAMLDACAKHDVSYVIRVKSGWEMWFDGRATDDEREKWLDDGDLNERFGAADLKKCKDTVDVDVTVGTASSTRRARLVSFVTSKGTVMFLTNLPRETHTAEEVGLVYRLRWSGELANKLCKSAMSVEEVLSRTEASARIVVHAAMMAALLAQAIVHEEHLLRGWVGDKRQAIKSAPIHPLAVAAAFNELCGNLGRALSEPDTPLALWDRYQIVLVKMAADPNWRRKPSALDVVKGRTHRLVPTHDYARDPVAALARLK